MTGASGERATTRIFFGTGCLVSVVAGLFYMEAPLQATPSMRAIAVVACLLLALAFIFGGMLAHRHRLDRVVLVTSWAAVPTIFAISVAIGERIQAPNLGFMAIIVCIVTVLTTVREGVRIASGAATGMLALALAEHAQWLPGVQSAQGAYLPVRLLMQWMVLAAALAAGVIMSKLLRHSLNEALERERRFRGLLRIAADSYWETDAQFRVTLASYHDSEGVLRDLPELIGHTPWELGDMGLDAAAMAAFRDDLRNHRPFSDLLTRQHGHESRERWVNIGGEPKFDEEGRFTGYWGVGRDVTAEVLARLAARASETRYQDLFTRSPAPLVLHRDGVVVGANEAAAALFGHGSVASMLGSVLREADSSSESLATSPARTAPLTDRHLRSLDGRQLTVQVREVQVDTGRGPATLAMYHDTTALAAAEEALRGNEAMMSHLFSTSPDVITLTELATGRYVMVNESFYRVTGYAAEQVIGRTASELGIWHTPSDRDRLVAALEDQGAARDLPVRFVTRSGALVTLQCAAARFEMNGQHYLVVNARDITTTERTQLEREAILQRASIGIAFTRAGHFVQANPRFEEMFHWPQGSLAGMPGSAVWLDDDDYAEVGRIAGPLLSTGQPVEFERQMKCRDGSLFLCRLLAQVVDRREPSAGGTVWIAEDVTERRRAEKALAAARDAAEAANRAKTAFLANTSHEIRTPLNGILGMAKLAMQAGLDEQRRQVYLQQVLDSAQNLGSIISDILDISKVEAGKLTLESQPFGLRDMLQSVHRTYLALAQAKGLELALSIAASVPVTVKGDQVRVRQILSNFITNAIKFTDRGQVDIEASCLGGSRVRLAVRDSGVGIEDETLAQLFVPFSQADQSITRRYGGTGLGLSICRELAQMMEGEVGVRSQVGQGSLFFADLHLPATDAAGTPLDTEAEDLKRLRGTHVLLAEDNPVNMMIGVAMLEQWGIRVTQASDGALAVQAVERAAAAGQPFDLVLMDVQMPQMSGYAASRALRRRHDSTSLPIVALTAAALVSERDEAVAAGMNDFLTKPIDAARLRQARARHLRTVAHG
jgi:PAS domain S-box-containing protein